MGTKLRPSVRWKFEPRGWRILGRRKRSYNFRGKKKAIKKRIKIKNEKAKKIGFGPDVIRAEKQEIKAITGRGRKRTALVIEEAKIGDVLPYARGRRVKEEKSWIWKMEGHVYSIRRGEIKRKRGSLATKERINVKKFLEYLKKE